MILFIFVIIWLSQFVFTLRFKNYNKQNHKDVIITTNYLLTILIVCSIFIVLEIGLLIEKAKFDGLGFTNLLPLLEIIFHAMWILNPLTFIVVILIWKMLYDNNLISLWNFQFPTMLVIISNLEILFYFLRYKSLIYFDF